MENWCWNIRKIKKTGQGLSEELGKYIWLAKAGTSQEAPASKSGSSSRSYFPEFLQQAMALAFANFGKSEEEIKKLGEDFTIKYFKDKLSSKDLKFTEKNINVIMKKDGKKWKVDDQNKDLFEILTFGFSKLADSMNGISEQK